MNFKGQNLLEITERFKTNQDSKYFSRTCNICSDTESPTANTLFHKVKFGARKAFFICFEMFTTTKSFSALQMVVRYGVRENTARLFMHKVREAMKSSENNPMDGVFTLTNMSLRVGKTGKQGRINRSQNKETVFNNLIILHPV